MKKAFDLEDRLIDFSVLIIQIVDQIPNTRAGNHLASQIVRSGTSVSLNYGEARGGKSRKDFIHKMNVVLKELRETNNNLRMQKKAGLFENEELLNKALAEASQLISIFVKSIETAKRNSD